jgi:hypothetical protein
MTVLDRRKFLVGAAGACLAAPVAGCTTESALVGAVGQPEEYSMTVQTPLSKAAVYVPGYMPNDARVNGRPLFRDRRYARNIEDANKPFRLLSRIGFDGDVTQALLPVKAHDVKISPDGSTGVLCGFEGEDHVSFDPETLDMVGKAPVLAEGWRGGGHAAYVDGGKTVLISERAPGGPVRAEKIGEQFGRITIRDAETLKLRGTYSTHGIDPHDIRLIENGRYLVIANYGSHPETKSGELPVPRHVVEACVTIIDVQDGKLVDKQVTDRGNIELRHLAAGARDRIFAIQVRLGDESALARAIGRGPVAESEDITTTEGSAYLPAATLKLASGARPRKMGSSRQIREMRHGLSIQYDPRADQAIASYPSAHRVMVFDGASGEVVEDLDTRKIGLRYPCGVTLLPDGKHYAVAGYWENLFVFERGSHRLVRDLCLYPMFFGHSHITAA